MLKKFIIFFLFFPIFGAYAFTCPVPDSCPSLGNECPTQPTELLASNLVDQCYQVGNCCYKECVANSTYDGTNCACNAGFGGDGTVCEQCDAGTYGPDVLNACLGCPTGGTSVAESDAITDCYKSCNSSTCSIIGGHFSGTCYYSSGTSSYLNVSGTCSLTCDSGYNDSGSGTCNPNTISVSYAGNTNTGGSAPTSPMSFAFGSTTPAPANIYTKTGYSFTGWACTGGNTSCDGDIIQPGANIGSVAYSGTITLTAQWSITTYNITYHLNSGTCPGGTCLPPTYNITSTVNLPIPTKSGSIFNGWYDNIGLNGTAVTTILAGSATEDKSFWAKWVSCPDNSLFIGGECKIPSGHKICGNNGCITVPSDIFYH